MTAFHRWLIKQRVYCERCDWSKGQHSEATTVIKDEKNRDVCVCAEHAGQPLKLRPIREFRGILKGKIEGNPTVSQTEEWDYQPRKKRTCH